MITKDISANLYKITKGAGISGIGILSVGLLKYITNVVIARNIGLSLYGLFVLGTSIVALLTVISKAGLENGVLKFVAHYKGKEDIYGIKRTIKLVLKVVVMTGLFFTIVLFLTSPYLSLRIFHKSDLTDVLRILSISLPFSVIMSILLAGIQGLQRLRYRVYAESFIMPLSKLALIAVFFLLSYKLFGVLWATVLSTIIATIFSAIFLKRIIPSFKHNENNAFDLKELARFCSPLFFFSLFIFLNSQVGILMLGHFKLSSDVGIYGVTLVVASLVILPLTSINAIFAPMIAEFFAKKDLLNLEHFFKIVTRWSFSLTLPIFILCSLFSREILGIFGQAFTPGVYCLIILSLAQLINASVGSVGYMIMMSGKSHIVLLNSAIVFIVNIAMNYFLIPPYGILGAALANAASIILLNIIGLIEVKFFFNMHPYNLKYMKPLIAAIISAGMYYLFKKACANIFSMNVVVLSVFIILISYMISVYLLRLEEEDKIVFNFLKQKLTFLRSKIV